MKQYQLVNGEVALDPIQQFMAYVRKRFSELFNCFEVEEFVVNCMSPSDLESLRRKLAESTGEMVQDTVSQSIPIICDQVMETVGQLCRAGKVKFMLWKDFFNTVNANLAEPVKDEQLTTVVEYLHNISELIYFPSICTNQGSVGRLVILDLKWLCQDIFGTFGNFTMNSFPQNDRERWSRSDLESCLKLSGSGDVEGVLMMLEHLELLFAPPGTEEYIVPAWLASEMAASVWKDSILFNVYHGVVYRWRSETGFFTQAFFARLQLRLLRHFYTSSGGERFLIWKDGIKCIDKAEVLVQVIESRLSVNMVARGYWDNTVSYNSTSDTRSKCWELLQAVGMHIEKLLSETSADGDWDKLFLSPSHLCQKQNSCTEELAAYTLTEVLAAAEKQEPLCNKWPGVEDQAWSILMAGYDLSVLTRLTRRASVRWLWASTLHHLCCMLDPEHPTGKDWRSLMEKIGQATNQDIQTLDANAQRTKCSFTFLVFQKYPGTSIGQLYQALEELQREDCIYVLEDMFKGLEE